MGFTNRGNPSFRALLVCTMDVSASGWHWRFTVSVPIQWQWNQCGGGCISCLWWLKDFCHFSLFTFSALPFFLTFSLFGSDWKSFYFQFHVKLLSALFQCIHIISYFLLFLEYCAGKCLSLPTKAPIMNFVLNFMAHYLLIFLIDNGTNWDSGMMHF